MNEVSTMASEHDSLDKCVRSNNVDKARALLEKGADANGTLDRVPYMVHCITFGKMEMARLLLSSGEIANPFTRPETFDDSSRYGAIELGSPKVLELFVSLDKILYYILELEQDLESEHSMLEMYKRK